MTRKWTLCLLLFFLALAPRLICLDQLQHSIIKEMLPLDTGDYAGWGRSIASGAVMGTEVFYAMPFYAYFLGIMFSLFKNGIEAVRLVQILLGAVNVVLIFYIASKVFKDKKIAILAFVLAIFFKLSVFYELLLESSTIATFFFLALICVLVSICDKPAMGKFILMGIICSLAVLAKANFSIIILLIIFWLALGFKEITKYKKIVFLISFILPVAIAISTVAARNYIVEKDFVPLTAHGGINFYLGNGPYANGRFPAAPFLVGSSGGMIKQSVLVASQAEHGQLKPSEASSYWMRETLKFIRDNPAQYINLLIKKSKLFISGIEMPDLLSYSFAYRFIPALRILWLSFFLLIPLGLAGMILTCSRDRKISILLILFAGYAVGIVSFMVNERYKIPLYPFFILFASSGIIYLFRKNVGSPRKAVAAAAFIMALMISVADKPFLDEYTVNQSASYNLIGCELWDKKDYQTALGYFAEAAKLSPEKADYHNSLGVTYMNVDDPEMAERELKEAIRINPNYFLAYQNLANLYSKQGRTEEANAYMEKYRELNPYK